MFLAQVLGRGRIEQRVDAGAHGEELDGLGRERLGLEELTEREPIESSHGLRPGLGQQEIGSLILRHRLEATTERRGPQVIRRFALLARRQPIARSELRHVVHALAAPAHEHEGFGVRLHERPQRQSELSDVVARERVSFRNTHGAGLAVEAVVEAQRAHAAADVAALRFEDRARVAATLQLERRAEAGQAGPRDYDVERPGGGDCGELTERRRAERGSGNAQPAEEVAARQRGHDAKR